jgi:hypothetical protein
VSCARVAALLVAVAACDQTWNLDRIEPARDARVIDTQAIDARPFDPAVDCPASYDLFIAGTPYRITANTFAWWDSAGDCDDDTDGFTHMAVAQTNAELMAFHDTLTQKNLGRWWLGAVQPAVGVTTPGEAWLWVTGEPIAATAWASPDEPNDGGDGEQGHHEQFALVDETRLPALIDLDGSIGSRALCECDGRRIAQAAREAISQSKPP